MKKIEYFLDCSSPWTYLSFRGILDLRNKKDFDIIFENGLPKLLVQKLIVILLDGEDS